MEQQQTHTPPTDTGLPVALPPAYPPGLALSSDPALAVLDQVWSSLMPLLENDGTTYDEVAGQFVNVQKTAADLAQERATARKQDFVRLLKTWDAEHDKTAEASARRRQRGSSASKDNLIAKIRSNISQTHCWKDVFDALSVAQDGYNNPKGIGVVRKWFRAAADKADLVEPFVDFIPNTEYTSVICGGLSFIIQACNAAKAFRNEAFELVGQLPEKIDIVSQYSELYSTDFKLQLATNQLYFEILGAIEAFMYWLMKDHIFEWLKPLFRPTAYNPLENMIAEVGKSSRQVENAVKLCDSKKLSEIGRGVDDIKRDVAEFRNLILGFIRAQFETAKWFAKIQMNRDRAQQVDQKEKDLQPRAYISHKELLLLLRDTDDPLDGSTHLVLRTGFSMSRENQNRSKWLMTNKKISHWFRARRKRTLLVNGNGTVSRITPMSFFCAMLIKSLASIDSIVVLGHFCGLPHSGDTVDGVRRSEGSGLLRSLLTQLVQQWKFGELTCLSKEDVEKLKRTGPDGSFSMELHLFRTLVAALPAGQPLFVIVDGINYFETGDAKADTKKVVERLNALLDYGNVEALVKIFVTSATRSFEVSKYFEEDERVEVPPNITGSIAGFADSQFDWSFGHNVARLNDSSN